MYVVAVRLRLQKAGHRSHNVSPDVPRRRRPPFLVDRSCHRLRRFFRVVAKCRWPERAQHDCSAALESRLRKA